ncbi:hypothetical protein ACU4GD_08390 [Cupriavidus basilensis]
MTHAPTALSSPRRHGIHRRPHRGPPAFAPRHRRRRDRKRAGDLRLHRLQLLRRRATIGKLFFPSSSPLASLLLSFATVWRRFCDASARRGADR